jgi:hypothetical protein
VQTVSVNLPFVFLFSDELPSYSMKLKLSTTGLGHQQRCCPKAAIKMNRDIVSGMVPAESVNNTLSIMLTQAKLCH